MGHFYDKRMAQEVTADHLGPEWAGYVVRVTGGNDKQGFPMKQGVLIHNRVKLLMKKGQSCYLPSRTGERKRKSVRGCIVNHNLSILNLAIVKKGEGELKVSPTSKSHEDWDQREPTTSESSLLWINPIQSLNTLSERLLKRT